MKTFIYTLALLIFSGCSTVAVPLVDATPVPAERIFEPALLAAGQHNAAFVRDPGAWGSLCPFDIYVDNVKVFSIKPGEAIQLNLPLGTRLFRLEAAPALCATTTRYLTSTLEPGIPQVYRIFMDPTSGYHLSRVQ